MPLPKQTNIYLPLLRVIADAGGFLSTAEAIEAVERYYPEISQEDKSRKGSAPHDSIWKNRVRWARQDLTWEGYLDAKAPRGIWRITPAGLKYLRERWHSWRPEYDSGLRRISVPQIESRLCEPASGSAEACGREVTLSEVTQWLVELGEKAGKEARAGSLFLPMFDIVWVDKGQVRKVTHVFIFCDSRPRSEILSAIQYACDVLGSRVFVVGKGAESVVRSLPVHLQEIVSTLGFQDVKELLLT